MFADVVGSTQLYEKLGNELASTEVGKCLSRLYNLAMEQEGNVIKTVGDEIMCVFAAPDSAVLAATNMQQDTIDQSEGPRLRLRIGLQHGDIIERDGDIFGDTVNVAARLTSIANPGQILTTPETASLLPAYMRASVRELESVAMKGKASEVAVSEVVWEQDEALTMIDRTPKMPTSSSATLTLSGPQGDVCLGPNLQSVSFGRDAGCTVVVDHIKVSRNHARIERRRGKFFLVDSSSNGTWVHFDSELPLKLRLEEIILSRSGRISFGEEPDAPTAIPMRFELG